MTKKYNKNIEINLMDLKQAIIYLRHQAVTIKNNHHLRRYWQYSVDAEHLANKLEDYEMDQRAKK